ncbi:hypothetical protein EK904_010099 [Melospiza melodia maxima]|nr:hypothetical protein EK904_010099 [Melospiza melodia maxima]
MEPRGKTPTEFTEPGQTQLRQREAKERLALPISIGANTVVCKENSRNCFSCRARAIRFRQDNNEAVGGFFSQIGQLYMVHHLWAYKDLQTREDIRNAAWHKPGWDELCAHKPQLQWECQNSTPPCRDQNFNITQGRGELLQEMSPELSGQESPSTTAQEMAMPRESFKSVV